MDDGERAIEVDRLLARWSEATRRRIALASEAHEFSGMVGQIRQAFGNPYFYGGPNHERSEHADESIARYSGFNSHDVVAPTVLGLIRVNRELRTIRERLRALGVNVE